MARIRDSLLGGPQVSTALLLPNAGSSQWASADSTGNKECRAQGLRVPAEAEVGISQLQHCSFFVNCLCLAGKCPFPACPACTLWKQAIIIARSSWAQAQAREGRGGAPQPRFTFDHRCRCSAREYLRPAIPTTAAACVQHGGEWCQAEWLSRE